MARWDGASRAPGPRLEGDRVEGSGHFGFGDHEAESPRDDPILSQPCSPVQVGNGLGTDGLVAGRSRTLAAWVADTGPLVWSQGLLWSFHRCGTRSPGHTHSLSHPAHPHTPRRCWASHVTPWGPRPGLDPGSEILSEGLDDPHATGDGPWRPALPPSPPAPSARGQPLWGPP